MKIIHGFILIDVDVAALNNAGQDTTTNLENAVATKKISKNGKQYPYVSGQSWRFWWRNVLQKNFNWEMSPVTREKKIAFTEADPFIYPDDDIFGYMRAGKKEVMDPKTKKPKSENVTLTRISPLKNSALIAASYNPVIQNWSSMTRQEGDAVPYGKDEYCAVMKGMFSLDMDSAGTFSMVERSGFKNINEEMKDVMLSKGAKEIDDPVVKDSKGEALKLIRMDDKTRLKRIKDTIAALKIISGGAKLTTNLADVTPKFIIVGTYNSGNHPFSHIVIEKMGKPVLSIEALKEVINEYSDSLVGNIYIGKRKGFMDELEKDLIALSKENENVEYGPVNEIIDKYADSIDVT
jgi:CRISPR-associated protein Cst2